MGRRSLVLKVLVAVAALLAAAPAGAEEVGPGYDIEMSRMIPMREGVIFIIRGCDQSHNSVLFTRL